MLIGARLAAARQDLAKAGVESPGLDSRLLLAEATGLDMAALIARGDEVLPELAEAGFSAYMHARLGGMSVARILGRKEFWGLSFQLNEATLEPRPDTETLVAAVLEEAKRRFPPDILICDLGTGSGAILIALLTELPQARGLGTDISESALDMARLNACRLGVEPRASFALCEFAEGPDGLFEIIVANPPYVRSAELAGLPPEVRDHEPKAALDGGPDGLAAYRVIVARAARQLRPHGLLALEVGFDQGSYVEDLCRAAGFDEVSLLGDLAGIDRVITATRNVTGSR